ncbi:hypothetical protein GIB67_009152 [Kingdonia uniflora]|uniref:Uncharacterized protein n=1 Tax=Kingdonia uniflora TaxID=39325 RepID=A0A7J7N285_9MAGN|nr:hypothetical protein GIB67_009152 [Kingdonia uniflora]
MAGPLAMVQVSIPNAFEASVLTPRLANGLLRSLLLVATLPFITSSSELKMDGGKHEADTQSKVVCQICNFEGHIVSKCPSVYIKCKKATCNGIMKLMISLTKNNYERKFLKCQHSICGSFQWLSDVINQGSE